MGMGSTVWGVLSLLLLSLRGPTGQEDEDPGLVRPTGPQEYCMWTNFETSCEDDEVVLMRAARYGRMRLREGGCLKSDHGHIGCGTAVLPQLDHLCSGKHYCSLPIPDKSLQQGTTCPEEILSYLEADYDCIKVASAGNQVCQSQPLLLTAPVGYVASVVTDASGYGLSGCPWTLQLKPGRRVAFTLLNFAYSAPETGPVSGMSQSRCQTYVRIKEGTPARVTNITGCVGDLRERPVYKSETNVVRIEVVPPRGPAEARRFLLKYEAFGCLKLVLSEGMSLSRKGNYAVVLCNRTGERFYLTCEGTQWRGELGNCTKEVVTTETTPTTPQSSGIVRGYARFPYGILVVIGIGVALGVAAGIVMLMCILVCIKRRKEKQLRSLTTDPLLEDIPHENEDNHANCNCEAAKIYLSTLEARSRATLLCSSNASSRDQLGSGSLPMPDMCLVERPLSAPDMVPERIPGTDGEEPDGGVRDGSVPPVRREMQTSFITFKPSPPRPCHKCGSPAHHSPAHRPVSALGLARLPTNVVSAGTLRHKLPDSHSDIYSHLPRDAAVFDKRLAISACSECAKENSTVQGDPPDPVASIGKPD